MVKFLLVYDSIQGQTEKIATAIKRFLQKSGFAVDRFSARDIALAFRPEDYAGVIVGAPVHAGHYPKALRKWVEAHAESLARIPSAFYSVCLGILQKDTMVHREERAVVLQFFAATGWFPKKWTIFAGGLAYSRYPWPLRHYMRWVARRAGADTDLSHDYEYTDWEAVERFTREFVAETLAIPTLGGLTGFSEARDQPSPAPRL